MFNPIKKYFRQAKQTRLDETKKNSIRESVLMFIEENPAPIIPRNTLGLFSVKLKPAYITIFSLVLVLVVAGAVSAQAGSALPGDPLYPVKVGVNEKVLQVLAFSDDAKTKLSVQLAETRLQEAEKLVVEGKMTTSTQAEIGSNFNVQADVVSKAIDKLNKTKNYNGAQKVASDFEASLKAHSQVLEKIKEIKDSKASGSNNAEKIRQKVNDEIQKIRDKIKTKTPVDNSGSLCGASENTIVTKVIDGDTIVVEGGFHVRLLGMDADEKGYPCYEPAKKRLEELVLGKTVKLEKDKTDTDQYDRCLRYIFLGNTNIDVQLTAEGFSVARFYPPDIKYKAEITSAEKQAIASKAGCKWSGK